GGLDFSFAGVKTALLYRIRELGEREARVRGADLAAAYQDAIVRALVVRIERALDVTGLDALAIGGGVAANGLLRRRVQELGIKVAVPDTALCTDNAAMIAAAARHLPALPYPEYLDLDAYATGQRGL
ncbi:MAG: tRNA N6-adenosine threonylcarbamoyltransferase, partial [Solirubrobacteraceae bacterium]|nr:tRNA N6-adenosine threonylcarbamoyltransferase [Solirubrobacteraceae bacterium]